MVDSEWKDVCSSRFAEQSANRLRGLMNPPMHDDDDLIEEIEAGDIMHSNPFLIYSNSDLS